MGLLVSVGWLVDVHDAEKSMLVAKTTMTAVRPRITSFIGAPSLFSDYMILLHQHRYHEANPIGERGYRTVTGPLCR